MTHTYHRGVLNGYWQGRCISTHETAQPCSGRLKPSWRTVVNAASCAVLCCAVFFVPSLFWCHVGMLGDRIFDENNHDDSYYWCLVLMIMMMLRCRIGGSIWVLCWSWYRRVGGGREGCWWWSWHRVRVSALWHWHWGWGWNSVGTQVDHCSLGFTARGLIGLCCGNSRHTHCGISPGEWRQWADGIRSAPFLLVACSVHYLHCTVYC